SAGTEPRGLAERVKASQGSAIQCVRLHSSRGGSGGAQASTPGSSGECISALPPQALRSATSASRSADKRTLQKPTQKRPPSIWCCLSFLSENTRSSSRSDQLPSLVEAPHLSRVERRIAFACREQRDIAVAIVVRVIGVEVDAGAFRFEPKFAKLDELFINLGIASLT